MATIEPYETKAGKRYMVRYRKPDRGTTKKRGFRTKRDAEAFAATVEVSKQRGEFVDATAARATIADLGPSWLERKRQLKPSAYRPLEIAWRLYVAPAWGARRVSDIQYTEVQAWVTGLTVGEAGVRPAKSPTTVIRAYGVLAAIMDDAVRDRRLLSNPARGVDLPRKTKKPHVYLSHEQVHDLAEASKYPALVRVLAYCGLRWGEATGLRVCDINMLRRRLNIEQNAVEVSGRIVVGTPKGYKVRSVPFPRFLVDDLAKSCEGKHREDLVFPGPDGRYLRTARVHSDNYSWFASAIDASGVPRITPHDLRHTAASFAISAGASAKGVQRMLGHASAAMTLDVYAELFDADLDAVSDALDDAHSRSSVPKMRPKGMS